MRRLKRCWSGHAKTMTSCQDHDVMTGLTSFLPSHVDFRPRQSPFPELIARYGNRALRLQSQAVPDPDHLPAGGGEVRPGLQRIHDSRDEPPERAVAYKVNSTWDVVEHLSVGYFSYSKDVQKRFFCKFIVVKSVCQNFARKW